MAETETAVPAEVAPALTKTDARELKALVSRDTKILGDELNYRYNLYIDALVEQRRSAAAEIKAETDRRNAEDAVTLEREIRRITRRVDALNKSIRETLDEMEEAGWRARVNRSGVGDKSNFMVQMPQAFQYLLPPTRDNSDLKARDEEINKAHQDAMNDLGERYHEARRNLTGREAEILRDLTLQSISSEAAREFILNMPSSDSLLAAPKGVEAIPAPVGPVEG